MKPLGLPLSSSLALAFLAAASLSTTACGDSDSPAQPDTREDTTPGLDVPDVPVGPDVGPDIGPDADPDVDPGLDVPLPDGTPGEDVTPDDTQAGDAGGEDVQTGDTGTGPDVTAPDGETVPTPAAVVVTEGSGGYLLRGTVLAPGGPIDPGEVLFIGDTIVCVAADCASRPEAAGVTVIETHGVISPGLIDGHNHITYNFLPEWEPGTTFDSRDVWRDNADYRDHVAPFGDNRNANSHVCPSGKWGELRSIIHGTTTVQGQSFNRACLDRLARNADHFHGLGHNHLGTSIASPADLNTNDALTLADRFSRLDNRTERYAIHMCEGLRGSNMAIEFESWAGRDPRSHLARHQGLSLLAFDGTYTHPTTGETYDFFYRGVSVLIHSLILTEPQMQEVLDTDSFVVWSPSSNLILYGETAPIERMLELGITIGIGPDWTPSGEDDLLGEMRVARLHGLTEGIDRLTNERIWRMATSDGAEVVGLGDIIGSLEVDYRADVTVFGRTGDDPYQAVLDSRAQDVRLVFIDGLAYYGDLNLADAAALNDDCEVIDACGTSKFICAKNTPGSTGTNSRREETVADIRQQLLDILAEYEREHDVNELIACE